MDAQDETRRAPSAQAPAAAAPPSAAPRRRNRRYANFFVGFRITDPAIITKVSHVQERIAAQFPELARCCVDPRTLHVSLCTLHLATEEEIQQAARILAEHSYKNGAPSYGDEPPSFGFRGLGFFGDHYLFYSPLDESSSFAPTLEELAKTLHSAFDALELTTGPFRKPYDPHVTIWKTTKHLKHLHKLNKGRATPIERDLGAYLQQLKLGNFGTEAPVAIELLSAEEKEPDGYYKAYQSARLVRVAETGEREHEADNLDDGADRLP